MENYEEMPLNRVVLESVWQFLGDSRESLQGLNDEELVVQVRQLFAEQDNEVISRLILQVLLPEDAEVVLGFKDFFNDEGFRQSLINWLAQKKENEAIRSRSQSSGVSEQAFEVLRNVEEVLEPLVEKTQNDLPEGERSLDPGAMLRVLFKEYKVTTLVAAQERVNDEMMALDLDNLTEDDISDLQVFRLKVRIFTGKSQGDIQAADFEQLIAFVRARINSL